MYCLLNMEGTTPAAAAAVNANAMEKDLCVRIYVKYVEDTRESHNTDDDAFPENL